jgi:signal peptidase I
MFGKVERGDVIVFDALPDRNIFDKVYFVKRVIAVGGDFLEIKDGKIKVNGVEVDETYANLEGFEDEIKTTIPEDCYYVMGDNRSHSTDSRYFGPIKKSQIVGTIAFQLTPKIEKEKFKNEQLKNIKSNISSDK